MTTITYKDERGKKFEDNVPESCLEDALDVLNLMGYSLTGSGEC